MGPLYVKDGSVVDRNGERVVLKGINLVCKDKSTNYVANVGESLFERFANYGYNVIRLGLFWGCVEPRPGVYDDSYLAKIREQAEWAGKHGLYVFLDMHQDLYGFEFSGGAPDWATITDGLTHTEGLVWSDAYLESPAVNRAFDNFWDNKTAADGIGIQDRYTAMWRYVVRFFSRCENVFGYDLMNEPYPGSSGRLVFEAIVATYAKLNGLTSEEVAAGWVDPSKRVKIIERLADIQLYDTLMREAAPFSQPFERDVLTPFYEKVGGEVRKENPTGLLLLETSYFCNMGIESALGQVLNGDGIIYSPHGYDLVVDTDLYDLYSQPRVDYIFGTHKKVQKRLGLPALVGEWGGFPNSLDTEKHANALINIFERNGWGQVYWCWHEGMLYGANMIVR